jgi:integrase
VIASTGLRRDEALGLRWSDVDLETGGAGCPATARGRKQGAPIFAPEKTSSGDSTTVEFSKATIGA